VIDFFKKHGKIITIIFTLLVGVILIITALTMLAKYKNEISERSSSAAKYNTLVACNNLEEKLNEKTLKVVEMASKATNLTEEGISSFLGLYIAQGVEGIKSCRYFDANGVLRESDGIVCTEENDVSIAYYSNKKDTAGYVGIYDTVFSGGTMSVVGFYAPVKNSDYMTGIVTYYTRQALVEMLKSTTTNEYAEFSVVCTNEGKVIYGLDITEGGQIFTYLRNQVALKNTVDTVQQYVQEGNDGTVLTEINGEDYLVSIIADKNRLVDIAIVELYRVDVLYASSLDFVQAIIAVVIVFAVVVLSVVIYLIVNSLQMKKTILNMETKDILLNCYNRHGFEKEVKRILDVNINSYFAIVVIQLRHFKHLLEICTESEINNLLKYLKITCAKTMQVEETYGHSEAGEFLMLLHSKDRNALLGRLQVHSFLAKQYKGATKFDVLLRYGIYEYRQDEFVTVSQMIDFANEANNTVTVATVENSGMKFNFYSDELRKIRAINDSMELRMEGALKNGEFQIFYQPKYSIKTKKQDGAEALVRWYDAETDQYNRPALFMSLFETNGFIVKLDKYVYTKVCEYLSYSIAKGRTIFPISVNISRVTAIQSDFVDFYTRTKKKYGIPNGLIMIEFTETFAYENYEILLDIVQKLHENGFKCSIDDFGCGYSSYKILKFLPMDEIKLDKFFLEKGNSNDRDKSIFESIIALGKNLGMKVTQEGVETRQELEQIVGLGCDAVQGYYYSHPLGLNDYLNFVEHTKDHNVT